MREFLAPTLLERALHCRMTVAAVMVVGGVMLASCSGSEGAVPPTVATPEEPTLPAPAELDKSQEQNVLRGTWSFMPGVTPEGKALRVERTGLAILKMTEGGRPPSDPEYEPNPPVNLFGTHLEMTQPGDVGIVAGLSEMTGTATISLLSAPSVRFDERLERQPGVDVTINGSLAKVRIWDGTGSEPSAAGEVGLGQATANAEVTFLQTEKGLRIIVNGHEVDAPGQVLGDQVWFSLDAGQSWRLNSLKAYPLNGNELSIVDASRLAGGLSQTPTGLWGTAAAHGHGDKLIGTAIDLAELLANPAYEQFVVENFNQITTETLAKFQALQPEEGKFQFAELDALVQFANAHNLKIHGHALVFTEAYPQWLHDKLSDPRTSEQEALGLLATHIETVVGRYNGKGSHGLIESWDVVNEPFDPHDWAQLNQENIWYKKLGPRYIEEAFRAAFRANPDGKFFLNEWGGETDADRREAMIGLVTDLKQRGVPIHGAGFQAHIGEETLDDSDAMGELADSLADAFRRLASVGLLVRISEASVAENGDAEAQSAVYQTLMAAAVRAPNCVGFTMWGASNSELRYFYFTGSGEGQDPGNDAPTVQDADGSIHERPAMEGLRRGASGA